MRHNQEAALAYLMPAWRWLFRLVWAIVGGTNGT